MEQTQLWKTYSLLGTMWKTKTSRFQAADRLRARAKMKGISLSFVSAYVLILSVLPKFIVPTHPDIHKDIIGLVAITASVLVLVMSVISIFDEDRLRAQYMHDNARDIATAYHTFKLLALSDGDETEKRRKMGDANADYQAALDRCPHNHDGVDYERTCVAIAKDAGQNVFWRQAQVLLWLYYDIYFWPLLFMILPILAAAYLFSRL